ncbi:ATP-binding SpoIIE family protein phosphatase [Micromonospora sp. BRA006-A]|nr:ATP-binding SpoIIE family protein phosphatase [Micromonospora sp. BRA006-A]
MSAESALPAVVTARRGRLVHRRRAAAARVAADRHDERSARWRRCRCGRLWCGVRSRWATGRRGPGRRRNGRCWPRPPNSSAGRRAGPPFRDPARHRPDVAAQHAAGTAAGPAPAAHRRATTEAWTVTRRAATSTTRSCCPPVRSAWCWATWPGDVQAAARMGQVRAALRALALVDSRPDAVLDGLDRLVASLGVEGGTQELFVTVVFGVVEADRELVTLASAGHPAPLIRRAGPGAPVAEFVDVPPAPPLGLGGRARTATVPFRPGDTLLLYSDGVVERRWRDLAAGMAGLGAAVTGRPAAIHALCAVATASVPGATEDDVAVLAVEYAVRPSRSASMEVPAEPTAPSRVRHWMTAQLGEWRVPEAVIGAAVLCTSELTTNALLHAGTAARVEVDLSAERLLVSVADSGTRGQVTRAQTDTLSSRGRGLGLIEELSDAWGTDPAVRGSTVWFEILIPAGEPRVGDAPAG